MPSLAPVTGFSFFSSLSTAAMIIIIKMWRRLTINMQYLAFPTDC